MPITITKSKKAYTKPSFQMIQKKDIPTNVLNDLEKKRKEKLEKIIN